MKDIKCTVVDIFLSSEGLQCGHCGWSEKSGMDHNEWIKKFWGD